MDNEGSRNETGNPPLTRYDGMIRRFEAVAVRALQLLILGAVALGTVMLFVLFANALRRLPQMGSADTLLPVLQNAYSGVLMVLLGLEILETLRAYFSEHHLQIEVILVVAMIAVGRRIIEADFGHMGGIELVGLGALIASLSASYVVVRRTHASLPSPSLTPGPRNDAPPEFGGQSDRNAAQAKQFQPGHGFAR